MMILSFTRSAAAALVVGSVLLVTASDGQAADMTAAEKHEAALEQCADLMKGQRSFCTINANNQYTLDKATEENSEGTVNYDFNDSNDTPEQKSAKESYSQATDDCMDMSKGQRSMCMIEAHDKYKKGMSW